MCLTVYGSEKLETATEQCVTVYICESLEAGKTNIDAWLAR